MVGLGRLELPTSRLSGVRSNQPELQALNRTVRIHTIRKPFRRFQPETPRAQARMRAAASDPPFGRMDNEACGPDRKRCEGGDPPVL